MVDGSGSGGDDGSGSAGSSAFEGDWMLRAACNAMMRAYARAGAAQLPRAFALVDAMQRCASSTVAGTPVLFRVRPVTLLRP